MVNRPGPKTAKKFTFYKLGGKGASLQLSQDVQLVLRR
jgi:hypothetical protein